MSELEWFKSENMKHDPFQAYFDHGFDFSETNRKNQNRKSFESAWDYQQKEVEALKVENENLVNESKAHLNALAYQNSHYMTSLKEIESLKAKCEKLEKCVEYYAEKVKYSINRPREDDYEFNKVTDNKKLYKSGKLARQTLREIRGEK